jgi:hypothetical protein
MANPRAAVDFTEVDGPFLTFQALTSGTGKIDYNRDPSSNPFPSQTTPQYGFSASISSDSTAKMGASGDILLGRIIRRDPDGMVVIQVRGAMVFPYTAGGTAPVIGGKVVCDGSGGVRAIIASSEWNGSGVVIQKDTTALTVTVLL